MTHVKSTKIVNGIKYLELVNTPLSCTSCVADSDNDLCRKLCGSGPTTGFWIEYAVCHTHDGSGGCNNQQVECYA